MHISFFWRFIIFICLIFSHTTEPEIDAGIVQQLAEMGFPWEACRKAVHLTGNNGTEAAMNWVMEHMGDPDFADPLVIKTDTKSE